MHQKNGFGPVCKYRVCPFSWGPETFSDTLVFEKGLSPAALDLSFVNGEAMERLSHLLPLWLAPPGLCGSPSLRKRKRWPQRGIQLVGRRSCWAICSRLRFLLPLNGWPLILGELALQAKIRLTWDQASNCGCSFCKP